jgi:hypothetical protein
MVCFSVGILNGCHDIANVGAIANFYTAALQVTCFDGTMLCAYFLSEYAKMWYYNEVQAFFA